MRRDSRVPQTKPSSRATVGRWLAGAILGLAATTLGAPPAHAQAWGVKGGLNLATVKLEDINTEAEASAVAGGFVRVPLGRLKLQVEGLFAQRRIIQNRCFDKSRCRGNVFAKPAGKIVQRHHLRAQLQQSARQM